MLPKLSSVTLSLLRASPTLLVPVCTAGPEGPWNPRRRDYRSANDKSKGHSASAGGLSTGGPVDSPRLFIATEVTSGFQTHKERTGEDMCAWQSPKTSSVTLSFEVSPKLKSEGLWDGTIHTSCPLRGKLLSCSQGQALGRRRHDSRLVALQHRPMRENATWGANQGPAGS